MVSYPKALKGVFLNHYVCECGFEFYKIYNADTEANCPRCLELVDTSESLELPEGGLEETCIWNGRFHYFEGA